MESWAELKKAVEHECEIMVTKVHASKTEMLERIQLAEQNQLFASMRDILTRLDRIEARLPEVEEE